MKIFIRRNYRSRPRPGRAIAPGYCPRRASRVRCLDMHPRTLSLRRLNPHLFVALNALAALCLVSACRSTPAPATPPVAADTWAVVNGRDIKRADVEKAFRRIGDSPQPLSPEETLTTQLGILDDMILEEI